MSFHDRIAIKAHCMGKTVQEFRQAAQYWSTLFWAFLIITLVVWYYIPWMAIAPGLMALLSVVKSISATMIETRLKRMQ